MMMSFAMVMTTSLYNTVTQYFFINDMQQMLVKNRKLGSGN